MRVVYPNELYHYNPYHDPRNGQFTTNGFGRRYRNPDGSLTDEGKQHYVKSYNNAVRISNASKAATSSINATNEGLKTAKRIRNSTKKSDQSYKDMSDEDLRRIVKRMNLEKQYKTLTIEDTRDGFDTVVDVLSIVGGVVGIAGGLATTYALLIKPAMK